MSVSVSASAPGRRPRETRTGGIKITEIGNYPNHLSQLTSAASGFTGSSATVFALLCRFLPAALAALEPLLRRCVGLATDAVELMDRLSFAACIVIRDMMCGLCCEDMRTRR